MMDEKNREWTLLSFAMNHVREAVYLIDKQVQIKYVNTESCRFPGYTRDELLESVVEDIDPDFPLDRWQQHWCDLTAAESMTFEGQHWKMNGHVSPVVINTDYYIVTEDRAMLCIVLLNLKSNTTKFTQYGDQVVIEAGSNPSSNTKVIKFIPGNGVSFDNNEINRHFGLFHRLHHKDEFEETGIGLANVHLIINRHGGRTWADEEVDHGATFFFSLPQIKMEA